MGQGGPNQKAELSTVFNAMTRGGSNLSGLDEYDQMNLQAMNARYLTTLMNNRSSQMRQQQQQQQQQQMQMGQLQPHLPRPITQQQQQQLMMQQQLQHQQVLLQQQQMQMQMQPRPHSHAHSHIHPHGHTPMQQFQQVNTQYQISRFNSLNFRLQLHFSCLASHFVLMIIISYLNVDFLPTYTSR